MGRSIIYSSDEERNEANRKYQQKHGVKPYKCDFCNIELKQSSKAKHLQSKKHIRNGHKPWKCDICNIELNNYEKEYHIGSCIKSEKHSTKENEYKNNNCLRSSSESETDYSSHE